MTQHYEWGQQEHRPRTTQWGSARGMAGLTANLTQHKITWKESLSEELSRSAQLISMSLGNQFDCLNWCGKTQPESGWHLVWSPGLCESSCRKMPDESNLGRKILFWLIVSGHRLSWWESHEGRRLRQLVTCTCSQEAGRHECWCSAHFLLFIQLPAHGRPTSDDLI